MSLYSINFFIFVILGFFIFWYAPFKYRKDIFLILSIIFCISHGVNNFLLVVLLSLLSYGFSLLCDKYHNKAMLIASIAIILLPLFAVKLNGTFNFYELITNYSVIGVSFYSLQAISYVIDNYKDKKNKKNILHYLNFMFFFPSFVSGPIKKYDEFDNQINECKEFEYDLAINSTKKIIYGLFKKLVIADNLSLYTRQVFNYVYGYKGFALLVVIFMYSIELYCDFSGYSDIVIGISGLFGFKIPSNFEYPLLSRSITEFWTRWHISLSNWLKRYIYIPLGGNRKGKIRQYINITIVFIASGLWHGTSINYLIWGLYHAVLQIIERKSKNINNNSIIHIIYKILLTYVLVSISWIFFNLKTIEEITYFFSNIFVGISDPIKYFINGYSSLNLYSWHILDIVLCFFVVIIFDLTGYNNTSIRYIKNSVCENILYIVLLVLIIYLYPKGIATDFVYANF